MTVATSKPSKNTYPVLFGVVATIVVGLGGSTLAASGINAAASSLLIAALITLLLIKLFPEKNTCRTWLIILMSVLGFLSALLFAFLYRNTQSPQHGIVQLGPIDCAVLLIGNVMIYPLFEEIVVRRLLFLGACEWLRNPESRVGSSLIAVTISLLFAAVHPGIQLYAFAFSLILCFMAKIGIGTINRAVLHACHNLLIIAIAMRVFS
jgi:membrane protease YdiL (CAAX protease family)